MSNVANHLLTPRGLRRARAAYAACCRWGRTRWAADVLRVINTHRQAIAVLKLKTEIPGVMTGDELGQGTTSPARRAEKPAEPRATARVHLRLVTGLLLFEVES